MKVCKRAGGKRDSWKQRFTLGAMFTHHQKTIVMDVDPARWSGQANRPLKSQGEAVEAAQAVCTGRTAAWLPVIYMDSFCWHRMAGSNSSSCWHPFAASQCCTVSHTLGRECCLAIEGWRSKCARSTCTVCMQPLQWHAHFSQVKDMSVPQQVKL